MARYTNPNEALIQSLLPPSGVSPAGDMAAMAVPPVTTAPVPQMQNMPQQQPGIGQRLGNFAKGIGDTPEEKQALMRFATSIMQPVDPRTGTVVGQFGQALQGSMDYLEQLKEKERIQNQQAEQTKYEREQAEKELELKGREVTAREKGVDVEERKLGPEATLKGAQADKAQAETWYLRNVKKEPGTEAGAKQSYAEKYGQVLYDIDQKKPVGERKYQIPAQATAEAVQFLEMSGKKSPAAAVADFYTSIAPSYSLVASGTTETDEKEKKVFDDLADMIRLSAEQATPYQQTVLPTGGGTVAPAEGYAQPKTQQEYDALPSGAIYIDPVDGKKYRKP